MDADQELPPPPSRDSDDAGGAGDEEPPAKSPQQLFKEQKAKAVKTGEALSRAIGDLNDLRKKPRACDALKQRVYSILEELKVW